MTLLRVLAVCHAVVFLTLWVVVNRPRDSYAPIVQSRSQRWPHLRH